MDSSSASFITTDGVESGRESKRVRCGGPGCSITSSSTTTTSSSDGGSVSTTRDGSTNESGVDTTITISSRPSTRSSSFSTTTTTTTTTSSSSSSSSPAFVPPHGLEERFQKLLTLQEESNEDEWNVVTQTDVDSLLYAKDMYELSHEEREQVLLDIHGVVSEIVEETPDFVQEKRKELSSCLLQANTKGTHAYSKALLQDATYIQSSRFQLPFLRCENWDASAASVKLLNFLEMKLQLFGTEKLCRDITISDLSKEDRKMLESGFFQLSSQRDVAGRAILTAMPMCAYPEMSMDSVMRAFYYMYMTAAHDVETQQKGLVLIGCNVGPRRQVNRKIAWHVHKVRQALPLKTMGIHYCYDDLRMLPMMTIGMLVSSASSRVRFRAHYGTVPELHHALTTFGIPDQSLPVTTDGEPKIKSFRTWIKSRKQQEDTSNNNNNNNNNKETVSLDNVIIVPGRVDVLLGRGKPIQEHFGNLRYHVLMDYYQKAYEDAKKFEKMLVAQTIVDLVHKYKGRFLRQEGAGWIEVEPIVARDKVSHAFRTRRTSLSQPNEQQQQQQQVPYNRSVSRSSSSLESNSSSTSTTFTGGKRSNMFVSTVELN
ncbi:hypothetical protein IV203_032344 [Nitzschia inconspicua]|uniref:DUF6824 domain-containing protein n=1 Tax=Nitzschia inconspicua TaxID=303405 RepID=A0A9K3KJH0_9STRA|nr:hypothetical protein IV203_032344 [Nitzschia inconspicua]